MGFGSGVCGVHTQSFFLGAGSLSGFISLEG